MKASATPSEFPLELLPHPAASRPASNKPPKNPLFRLCMRPLRKRGERFCEITPVRPPDTTVQLLQMGIPSIRHLEEEEKPWPDRAERIYALRGRSGIILARQ
ncbi:MAG TPA: hypothetical protein VMT03_25345 [Polyangia bacterium]|nr:hypothetical protein [Polyangia bacterium]